MKSFEARHRILFFTVHAAFFVSHRLNLAVEAKNRGAEVYVIYGIPASREMTEPALEKLQSAGIKHRELSFSSRSLSLLNLTYACLQLMFELIKFKPTIIHSISSMPVLLMLIASLPLTNCLRVFAVSGFGAVKSGWYFSVFRKLVRFLSRQADIFIFQNIEDKELFSNLSSAAELIPGSGVNQSCLDLTAKRRNVLFAARLMHAKGVEQFCKVAEAVREIDSSITFTLAGASDYDHPDAISKRQLLTFDGFESVEYVGFQTDMNALFSKASLVFYPSLYAEGLSKTLLEGAMASCVIVTYDRPGCREAVLGGESGILAPLTADTLDFAEIILNLLSPDSDELLTSMMVCANKYATDNFSVHAVTARHMEIYDL